MRQKFDLQLFAAGDNNDLPARSYQLEFKRLLQAVFKKRAILPTSSAAASKPWTASRRTRPPSM